MRGFIGPIRDLARANRDASRILHAGPGLTLTLFSLKPGRAMGPETRSALDRFIRIEKGRGCLLTGLHRQRLRAGDGVLLPAGTRHVVLNTGRKPLRISMLCPGATDHLIEWNGATAQDRPTPGDSDVASRDMINEGGPVLPDQGAGK